MDVPSISKEFERAILAGDYGPSGERFVGMRELSRLANCAYMTATRAMEQLREAHVVALVGHEHYVTTGVCAPGTPLHRRLLELRRPCFGMLINEIDNHCFTLLVSHLQKALCARGYELIVMVNFSDAALEKRQVRMMLDIGVSGIFFFPHSKFKNQRIYECCPLPVAAMGRQMPGFGRSAVTADNYIIGKLAALHLKEHGYRQYFYIGPTQHSHLIDMRRVGFADRLGELGIPFPEENALLVDNENVERDLKALSERILVQPQPTGIFCYHDIIASELLKLCIARRIEVPGEVGIVGCDNLPITTATTPKLSTVNYPYARITQMAVEVMLLELQEGRCRRQRIEVPPQLIPRESTQLHTE